MASLTSAIAGELKPVVKIVQTQNGNLIIDGRPAVTGDLDQAIREIGRRHGFVEYCREAPYQDSDTQVIEILADAEKYNVAIETSKRRDFSDVGPKRQPTKAVALFAPRPNYPDSARDHGIGGAGIFVLHLNPFTGVVSSIKTKKSTGVALLDDCARSAFAQWKFKPNAVTFSHLTVPIRFVPRKK